MMAGAPPPALAAIAAAFIADREPSNQEATAAAVEVIGLLSTLCADVGRIANAFTVIANNREQR